MPNLLLTNALAKRLKNPDGVLQLKDAFESFKNINTLDELLELEYAESLIFGAVALYPDLFVDLIQKVAKQSLNSVLKKSYFTGNQCVKWSEMLTHGLFTESSELDYDWIGSGPDVDRDAVRQKVYSIFMERSSILFNNDQTTLWLKETVGYLLNMIDESDDDFVSEFIGKAISTV